MAEVQFVPSAVAPPPVVVPVHAAGHGPKSDIKISNEGFTNLLHGTLTVGVILGVGKTLDVGVTDGVTLAEFEGVTVGVFVTVIVGVTDGLAPAEFEGVTDEVFVGVTDEVFVGVTDGVFVGVTDGVVDGGKQSISLQSISEVA